MTYVNRTNHTYRLQALHYDYRNGYDIQPEGQNQERESFGEVVLKDRLSNAIDRLGTSQK